jgi:hypothetical protein
VTWPPRWLTSRRLTEREIRKPALAAAAIVSAPTLAAAALMSADSTEGVMASRYGPVACRRLHSPIRQFAGHAAAVAGVVM